MGRVPFHRQAVSVTGCDAMTKAGDLENPLLARSARCIPRKARTFLGAYAMPALATLICVTVGVLQPLAAESSKTAKLFRCERTQRGEISCSSKVAMPFHPVSMTLSAEFTSVMGGILVIAVTKGAFLETVRNVLQPAATLRFWPIGAAYGVGDLLQAVACNCASAPVVLVISQCKLLLTALLSAFFIGYKGPQQWNRLVVLSCAALAGACIGTNMTTSLLEHSWEVYGAGLAFLKQFTSAMGAVLAEVAFRKENIGFWMTSVRVQTMMLSSSLIILLFQWPGLRELFLDGPEALCLWSSETVACDPLDGKCDCLDHVGWDRMTVLSMLAIVANGLSTGFTLTHLSAVGKSICGSLSVALFYPLYVALGFKKFDLGLAAVLTIIIISSHEYAMEKANVSGQKKRKDQLINSEFSNKDMHVTHDYETNVKQVVSDREGSSSNQDFSKP